MDPRCYPENAFAHLDPRGNRPMREQAAATQEWINHCQPRWFTVDQNSFFNLLSFSRIGYPIAQPYLRRIDIPTADGRRLPALLALKPGSAPRDLVVLRCGVFCQVSKEGPILSEALMNVFEENPVNLLILASNTSPDYAQLNGVSHIGGFDEGYQNLEAARYLMQQQSRLGLRVREVHVMGASLGGLSVLFSSYYKQAVPEFADLPVKTFTAVCPLVDADYQFNDVFRHENPATWLFRHMLGEVFPLLQRYASALEVEMVGGREGRGPGRLDAALNVSAGFYATNWDRLGFARYLPRNGVAIDRALFLKVNNLLYFRNRFAPRTLVLGASDDILLDWRHHAGRLVPYQDEHLGVLKVDRGNHCAFNTGLGWPVFSGFITQALGLRRDLPKRRFALPPTLRQYFASRELWSTETRSLYSWSVAPGDTHAKLKVTIYNNAQNECYRYEPTFTPIGNPWECHQQRPVRIPLAELAAFGLPDTAGNALQANRLERYLNVHARILTLKGQPSAGSQDEPAFLELSGRFHPDAGVL